MSFLNKTSAAKKTALFLLGFSVLWIAAAALLLRLPLAYGVKFIVFQIVCVVLPGAAIYKALGIRTSLLEAMVISYALGLAVVIAAYFCLAPFGLMDYISYLLLAVGALAAVSLVLMRKRPFGSNDGGFELKVSLIFAVLASVLTFILLSMANLNPLLSGARTFYHDTINGVGLTVAASRGFPMMTIQMAGCEFRYHIFFYSYTSAIYKFVGAAAFETVMDMSLITISPFAVCAFIALLSHFVEKKWMILFGSAVFTLIPAWGLHYEYVDTIAFPLGTAFGCLAVLCFDYAQNKNSKLNVWHALASLFLVCSMGAKGPVAVSYLFGICFVLLVELISIKNGWVIPKGLCYAIPFFALYVLLYSGGAGDSMAVRPMLWASKIDSFASLENVLPLPLYRALQVLAYCKKVMPAALCCLVVCIAAAIAKKKLSLLGAFTISSVLEGYILMNIFSQMGSSETYFLIGVYPVIFAAALYEICELLSDGEDEKQGRRIVGIICAALVALSIPASVSSAYSTLVGRSSSEVAYATGLKAVAEYSPFTAANRPSESEVDASPLRAIMVTPKEYEAYTWLRYNTPEDAVIASYRYMANNKYFCGSCFSERSFYLEGWGYVTMEDSNTNTAEKVARDSYMTFMFTQKADSFARTLYQNGVTHILLERTVTGDWEMSDEYVDEVFRNSDVIIYCIKPWTLD